MHHFSTFSTIANISHQFNSPPTAGEISNYLVAILVLIVQISLTFLLFQSIPDNESGTENFEITEFYVITPIIAIFSTMLV